MSQSKYPLRDEVIIITGASRGIGRAIAVTLARVGAKVVLAARSEKPLKELAAEIEEKGGQAIAVPTDVSHIPDLGKLVKKTIDEFGKITVLINNAGVGIYGPAEECTTEEWDAIMKINARAPFLLCRDCVPLMRRNGGGFIINIASVVGVKGYRNQSLYSASKHALMGFSKVLAQEVQEDNIRVHTLCFGGVETDMVQQARPDLDPKDLMKPDEIARAILFLLTFRGNAVIDNLQLRRASGDPWF